MKPLRRVAPVSMGFVGSANKLIMRVVTSVVFVVRTYVTTKKKITKK